GQGQPTPRQHSHQTVVAKRTDEAIEGHGGEMVEDRAQLQTESPVGGQQGIAGYVRSHLTIAQDEMGQDGEHGTTGGAPDTPDGDSTQADPDIMRVARQSPTAVTGRLVEELKAKRQHEGENTLEKRLPIAQQMKVRDFVSKIDGNGVVSTGLAGRVAH